MNNQFGNSFSSCLTLLLCIGGSGIIMVNGFSSRLTLLQFLFKKAKQEENSAAL